MLTPADSAASFWEMLFPGSKDKITYVIGHRNPDADSVGSAMACAWLLNQIGITAEAATGGPVNSETAYALRYFDIQEPRIIEHAEDGRYFLVDHSSFSQAIEGMSFASIAGIVDHHSLGDILTSEGMNIICVPVGATASLIYSMYIACGIEIPCQIAQLLLMSILSDTRNMTRNVTPLDCSACKALTFISGVEDTDALYNGMKLATAEYSGMTDWEIFQSDCKAYEICGTRFCIGDVNAFGETAVIEMADRMRRVMSECFESMNVDMAFAIINNKGSNESENMMYMIAYDNGAELFLREAMGHECIGGYFIFKKNLSRKTDVVPAITALLSGLQQTVEQCQL